MDLNKQENGLLKILKSLHLKLMRSTKENFNRVNPLVEDLTDWKERGEFLFGKGKDITVYNTCTVVGDVEVGEKTWIGPYTALDGGKRGIRIGRHCSISSGVSIVGHDSVKWALSGGVADYEYGPIRIGDYCFVGTNSVITKGVSIGNHCVVGANAVVTESFEDYSIILGVPGKLSGEVVRKGADFELKYF